MSKTIISLLLLASVPLIVCKSSYLAESQKSCGKSEPILFKENESNRMIEIVFINKTITDCFLYGDQQLAQTAISKKTCQPKEVYVTRKQLTEWALKCSDWLVEQTKKGLLPTYSDEDFPPEYNNKIDRNFFDGLLIFPGTKWCGAGHIAEDYDDLGEEVDTDKCCRAHDHCFDSIGSGDTKYELKNSAVHTKSHCDCDDQFKDCLGAIDRTVPETVAKLYFNLIQIQCFREDHPIIKCLEWRGIPFFWESCQKYLMDLSKDQIYQFFDALFVD